ncbi:hypothetical protein N9V13_04980 [Betaproteobacteria bacterium]|nr:hypothetical protein [Betaproteobacteria bacterium]
MGKVLVMQKALPNLLPGQSAESHENNSSTTRKRELKVLKQESYMREKQW